MPNLIRCDSFHLRRNGDFYFLKWRPSGILDLFYPCLKPPTNSNWSLSLCKIWFEKLRVSVLCEVGLKMSAYAPLGGIFGGDGSKWENENFLPFYRYTSRNAITWSFF